MNKEINIGNRWKEIVSMSSSDDELSSVYKKELSLIFELFNEFISTNNLNEVTLADFGGGTGEITDYLKENTNIKTVVTCFDSNEKLLSNNKSADNKIVCDLVDLKSESKFDIGLMRFVLNYNSKEKQKEILKNIKNTLKDDAIFINWWCGVSDKEHQRKFQELFNSNKINKKLFRSDSYWTEYDENLDLFNEVGFEIKTVKSFSVPISDLYKKRYELTDEENKKILDFLGSYNFISYNIFIATKR